VFVAVSHRLLVITAVVVEVTLIFMAVVVVVAE
jgi:hypothetical protein